MPQQYGPGTKHTDRANEVSTTCGSGWVRYIHAQSFNPFQNPPATAGGTDLTGLPKSRLILEGQTASPPQFTDRRTRLTIYDMIDRVTLVRGNLESRAVRSRL
jgi:hypothetical protein